MKYSIVQNSNHNFYISMQLSVVISGMQAVPEIDRSVTSPRSPLFGHDTQLSGGISGQCMPYSRVCFQKRVWPGHGLHSDIVCRPCADSPDAHKFPRFLFRVAAPVQTDLPPCKSLGERLYGSCSGSGDAERPQALFQRAHQDRQNIPGAEIYATDLQQLSPPESRTG